MEMKKLHMGTAVFGWDAMDEISHLLSMVFAEGDTAGMSISKPLLCTAHIADHRRKGSLAAPLGRGRRDIGTRVRDAVLALATCHNVG
jgi:phospholipid-translocating ATPase